jgi:hypothetical protein
LYGHGIYTDSSAHYSRVFGANLRNGALEFMILLEFLKQKRIKENLNNTHRKMIHFCSDWQRRHVAN